MNTLLELTWRGSLLTAVVVLLDRRLAARLNARGRRGWWLLIPLAFLVTVPLPVLPAWRTDETPRILPPEVALRGSALRSAGAQPVAATLPHSARATGLLIMALTGSALHLLVVLARTYRALRQWRQVPLCTDPALLRLLDECKVRAGVTAEVGLVVSAQVPTALTLGGWRPCILLPDVLVASLSGEQLRGVLLHELAHIRFRDVLCTCLFTLARALHWFNPAAHLALRAWSQFREEAADEAAIHWLGTSHRLTYGETLLRVLRVTQAYPSASPVALAVVASVAQLKKRLTMIKQHRSKPTRLLLSSALLCLLAPAILLRPVRAAQAPSPASPPVSTAPISAPGSADGVTPGLTAVQRKLAGIILPSVEFRHATLKEAVDYLHKESTRLDQDPDSSVRGVTFLLQMSPEEASQVHFQLTLSNVPLGEVLRYMAAQADVQVVVGPTAVTVSRKAAAGTATPVAVQEDRPAARKGHAATDQAGVDAMNRKLAGIVVPEVDFDHTRLGDAVEFLREESARLDTKSFPAERGINIFVKLPGKTSPESLPRIVLASKQQPLLEVLRTVARQTGMQVVVEPYAVSLVPGNDLK